MTNKKSTDKDTNKTKGIDSSNISIDDAGRVELDDELLKVVSGGLARKVVTRGAVCQIQTSTKGCSMNM